MSEPSYLDCWMDFLARTDEKTKLVEFFKGRTELRDAERILSFGPGTGEVDAEMLRFLPGVNHYIGVEPHEGMRGKLAEKLEDVKGAVKVELVPEITENYSGPAEPVDLILMVHVCYYFKETVKTQIQRVLRWLRPGGHLVLVHQKLNALRSEMDQFMKKEKNYLDIVEEMKIMGIPFTEYQMGTAHDWAPAGLSSVIRILMDFYPDQAQLEQCAEIYKRYSKEGTTKCYDTQLIHIIPQTAVNHLT